VSKNNCDTFCDIWWHPNGIMKWWFRIAVAYHTIMVLIFLAMAWEVVTVLPWG
jgi:hypothetical protein